MVNIAVCIKAVPDDLNVHISRRTGEPQLEGMRFVINRWEKAAIEMALRLKEESAGGRQPAEEPDHGVVRTGGSVTVFTMDEPTAELALREALAMGCDKAVLLHDHAFEGSDTLGTARVLAAAMEKARVDVVITGGRTADRRSAQVGPMVAQLMNIPAVTFVRETHLSGRSLQVKRRIRDKVATYEVPMPCLISTSDDAPRARIATSWGVGDAFRDKEVQTWNRRDLDLHAESVGRAGSPTKVRRFEKLKAAKKVQECEFYEGEPEEVARSFVRRLRNAGVIR